MQCLGCYQTKWGKLENWHDVLFNKYWAFPYPSLGYSISKDTLNDGREKTLERACSLFPNVSILFNARLGVSYELVRPRNEVIFEFIVVEYSIIIATAH